MRKFSELYRMKDLGIGVNEYFLQRDIEDIKEEIKRAGISDGEVLYGRLKHGDAFGRSKIAKRNFFAHSGFLLESTLLRVDGGRIYARWDENDAKEFVKWLRKPEM